MVTRIFHATLNSALLVFALALAVGMTSSKSFAQNDTPTAPVKPKKAKKAKAKTTALTPAASPAEKTDSSSLVKASGGESDAAPQEENLKFNTDSAPVSSDRHPPMTFKDEGETPVGTPRKEYAESAPEDAGYKAYIGYPKHQLGIYLAPMSIASKWTGTTGEGYNFTTSATAFGLNYRVLMTPLWSMEFDYSHFTAKMDPASLKVGSSTLTFQDSKASFDNYFLRNRFCIVGKSTFYQQLCPGFDIGNDGYPIVNYTSNSTLAMARVQDITVGLNLAYQAPFGESFLFRAIAGYNYGTGIGNSGYLTSKNNSSYYLNGGFEWNVTEKNIVTVAGEFKNRSAKVSGQKGPTTDSWKTESSTLGGKVGYIRSF